MMIIGTLPWVASGALAMALGENTNPASMSTFSRVISSCTAVFAISPPGLSENVNTTPSLTFAAFDKMGVAANVAASSPLTIDGLMWSPPKAQINYRSYGNGILIMRFAHSDRAVKC